MAILSGLARLTWLEIKIFLREPLGVIGTAMPVVLFLLLGRLSNRPGRTPRPAPPLVADLPILASILIAVGAVLSLVAIVAIYREGGILKRLRATPLHPLTILTAHVLVKIFFTAVTLGLMLLAGRRVFQADASVPLISFAAALLFTTLTISSLGFVIASLVTTARFAQPVASLIVYPMVGLSGLLIPLDLMPAPVRAVSRCLPLTYAVSLLRGIWRNDGWSAHAGDLAVLGLTFAVCTAVAAMVFRWE
jgi:ABC-2 type transport system permease protein